MKSIYFIPLLFLFLFPTITNAQPNCYYNVVTGEWETLLGGPCDNSILTSVPFLRLPVDARSGGMGEAGIATSSDVNAINFNESKLVLSTKEMGFALNYKPWNSNDINLFQLTGFKKLSDNDAVGIGLKYFSLGKIEIFNSTGGIDQTYRPKEIEIEAAYSKKISQYFSLGFGAKYIISDLASGQVFGNNTIRTGKSFAFDGSFTYSNNNLKIFRQPANLTVGLAVSNIGQKISYTNTSFADYIPANIGLGTALKINASLEHSITFAIDVNKLLVPTPSAEDDDFNNIPDFREHSSLSGAFSSFNDAPLGTSEEFNELQYSIGLEYWFKEKWALRSGYYSEHETKGNKKFLTFGIGSRFKNLGFDVSIEVPQTQKRDVFERTMRFTMLYNFEKTDEMVGSI